MSRRRRLLGGLLAGGTAVALLTSGCGVPTSSEVQYVGPGPDSGAVSPGDGGVPPPHPDEAARPGDQVDNFLQAAAGDPATAVARVGEYLHSSEQAAWRPDDGIRVIRLLQEPFLNDDVDGGWLVEAPAQVVGELHPQGYLDAPTVVEPVTLQFRVVTEGGPESDVGGQPLRLRIADPPPYLVMEASALTDERYYFPNPIYFWDADHDKLVPDLRWLPLAGEPIDQHPWRVVQWLLTGPAPGLPRIEGLPAGTAHIGTPVWEDDRLIVNFNAAATEGQDLDDLATQLARSLLQLRAGEPELELRIDDRPQRVQVRPREPDPDPTRFVMLDGEIHQYGVDRSVAASIVTSELNQGIHSAALTNRGLVGALVRQLDDGRFQLSVVDGGGEQPAEQSTGLRAGSLGQLRWVNSAGRVTGLVLADGALHWFSPGTGQVAEVAISGLAGPVIALAVAPEGRRLALVAGDRLYVVQLRLDAETVTAQAPRALPTTLTRLAGVAFTHENSLVVAGEAEGRVGLHQLSVDGAVQEPMHDLSNASVTVLVAQPVADPLDLATIMYEANGQAYTFTGGPSLVQPEELVDGSAEAESPPRAPFFLG